MVVKAAGPVPVPVPVAVECGVGEELDRAAFEAVYRSNSSAVYTHFLQRRVAQADADDLTAEVFAIAWRRRNDIAPHPTAGLMPWLLGTANTLLKAKRRSLWRAHRALGKVGKPVDVPDIALNLADLAEDRHRLDVLVRILHGLSVPEQEVVQFCVLRGIPPKVVAEVTGEPVGTIRSRLSRALGKARGLYARHEADLSNEPRSSQRRTP